MPLPQLFLKGFRLVPFSPTSLCHEVYLNSTLLGDVWFDYQTRQWWTKDRPCPSIEAAVNVVISEFVGVA